MWYHFFATQSSEPLPEIDLSQQRQLNSPKVNLSKWCEHISVSDQELIALKVQVLSKTFKIITLIHYTQFQVTNSTQPIA